jgi:hypothetical protein
MVKTEWIARRGRFTAPTADLSAPIRINLSYLPLVILSAAKDLPTLPACPRAKRRRDHRRGTSHTLVPTTVILSAAKDLPALPATPFASLTTCPRAQPSEGGTIGDTCPQPVILSAAKYLPPASTTVILSAAKDLSDQSSIRTPCKDVMYLISLSLTFHNTFWYSKY